MADCHFDHGRHGEWNESAWDRAVGRIAAHDFNACIISGDLFERGQATGEALNRVAHSLMEIVGSGTPVVYLLGNHEWIRVPSGNRTAASVLDCIDGVTVVDRPSIVEAGEVLVAALPWPVPGGESQADSAARLAEELDARCGSGDPRIAAAHSMVTGAKAKLRHGSEVDLAMLSGEATATLAEIDLTEAFARTLLGHVHRRQKLSETCGYIGAIDRITFADEGQKRGFSVLTWDGDTGGWTEKLSATATREFLTVPPHADLDEIAEGTLVRVDVDMGDSSDFNPREAARRGIRYCGTVGGGRAVDVDKLAGDVDDAMYDDNIDLIELVEAMLESEGIDDDRLRRRVRAHARRMGWDGLGGSEEAA